MAFSFSIENSGVKDLTFDNPPNQWEKSISIGNFPVPHYDRLLSDWVQLDNKEMSVTVRGKVNLNDSQEMIELGDMKDIAVEGNEVFVSFDPFYSGWAVIENNPFEHANEQGRYEFQFNVNTDETSTAEYPGHTTDTPNTFELGDYDIGYDPSTVRESYGKQTETITTLEGVSQTKDTEGIVPKITLSGPVDGAGQEDLWEHAKENTREWLQAEWFEGWVIITDLSVEKSRSTPHYTEGLYRYSLEMAILKDITTGIQADQGGVNYDTQSTGTYVSSTNDGDLKT